MPSFEEQICEHARRDAPRECCGLVLRRAGDNHLTTLPTDNVAEDPARHFEIPMAAYLAAHQSGNLIGYYHSHPAGSAEPTLADRQVANEVNLPLWVYGVPDDRLEVYVPDGYRQPLEGRRFVPMVFDCVALVWDYFRDVRGIELPFLPRRRENYYTGIVNFAWDAWLRDLNAKIVAGAPEPGDILVMALGASAKPNHLAVYVGDSHFLHQPPGRLSCREVWVGDWMRNTQFIVRVPDAKGEQP